MVWFTWMTALVVAVPTIGRLKSDWLVSPHVLRPDSKWKTGLTSVPVGAITPRQK